MVLRDLGPADDAAARRERFLRLAEGRMGEAAGAAIRQFLRNVLAAVTPESLTAATGDVPTSLRLFTLGEAAGWWDDAVADHVVDEVRAVWRAGYFDTRDGDLLASDQRAIDDYLANVTDRLSTTATPTIPEQAFDIARSALADEVARSSSIDDIALRLAQDFSWDADATLARRRLAETDSRIDAILDAIGPPGDPAREAARLGGDAEVARLQEERREWIRQRDRTRSEWQTRAERIARTETCGAYNAGAIDAAFVEGQAVKVWMGTGDERTRDEHLAAAGQCVPIEDRFTVGGEALVMPGDPQGSPGMIINCRCTVVFADSCEEASRRFAGSQAAIDRERAERGLAGDELDGLDAGGLVTARFGSIEEWSDEDIAALLRREEEIREAIADQRINEFGNPGQAATYEVQGYNAPPIFVDNLDDAEGVEVFRGVQAYRDASAQELTDRFVNGDRHWAGEGISGSGTYTTTNRQTAETYGESVSRMRIHPDARVVDHITLRIEHSQALDDVDRRLVDLIVEGVPESDPRVGALQRERAFLNDDEGLYAARRGYDVIHRRLGRDDPESYYVVLNRGVLQMERP